MIKKFFTWILIFQKRILKKPMFTITLFLIPALLILLFSFHKTSDSLINVGLYAPNDYVSKSIIQDLLVSSNSVISFYQCDSEAQLKNDVLKGTAECGYLFPDNFDSALTAYLDEKEDGIITVLSKEESISTKIVNEILCGKIFSKMTYPILEKFVESQHPEKLSPSGSQQMQSVFAEYCTPQLFLTFEYADGAKNEFLNDNKANYYMLPVRGILSVLILVSAISGILMLSSDNKKGTWNLIKIFRRPIFHYFYIFMTILPVTLLSLLAIFVTGTGTTLWYELVLIIIYACFICGFSNLLRGLIRNIYILYGLLPVLVLISLVLCPVFIDLGSMVPGIIIIRIFLPTSYYLEAVYNPVLMLKMSIAALLTSAASLFLDAKQ